MTDFKIFNDFHYNHHILGLLHHRIPLDRDYIPMLYIYIYIYIFIDKFKLIFFMSNLMLVIVVV